MLSITNTVRGLFARSATPSRPRLRRRPLRLECLEERRLLCAGSLDPTFGTGGIVTTDFPADDTVPYAADSLGDLAVQADGKIVAAGTMRMSYHDADFAVARYNPNGTLDTSFGQGGKVTTSFGKSTSANRGDEAAVVAIQTDGKIVVGGKADQQPWSSDFALARFNTNGTLDSTFGKQGKVRTDFGGQENGVWSMAIQPNGKIIAVGRQWNAAQVFAARYNANGSLDPSFDGDGKLLTVLTNDGVDGSSTPVALQSDGKILIGGRTSNGSYFNVARYNPNGTLDTSFAGDGTASTEFGFGSQEIMTLAVQPDGKIVAVGWAKVQVGVNYLGNPTYTEAVAMARYNADGTSDVSFGLGGTVTTRLVGSAHGRSIAVQTDGKIVVGVGKDTRAVIRYNADGSLDPTFGTSVLIMDGAYSILEGNSGTTGQTFSVRRVFGVVPLPFGGQAVELQSDGRIVVGDSIGSDFAIARIEGGPGCSPADTVSVDFATSDGTAINGSDYVPASGVLTFGLGETATTITIQVIGDTLSEPNEDYFVNLANAVGATIFQANGRGFIINDD